MTPPSIIPASQMNNLTNSMPSWSKLPFQLEMVKAEKARRSFKEFVRQGWHVLEPNCEFVDGIHVDAICTHLQAVNEGRIPNLIITVPPRHGKSLLVCVFWLAWVWIDHPETRWLFASHREPLAVRDSLKSRSLIESDWYRRRWGDRFQLRKDQNQKQRFENDKTGYRVVVPMSAGTGEGGDYIVVDDPHSVDQAESDTERSGAVAWWNGAMSTRLDNPSQGHKIVVQQRLHEADLAGDLLLRGGYELLCLPEEFDPDRRCCTSIGWTDPRTEPGQLLCPDRIERTALEQIKASLGGQRYAAQYQQLPAPADGGLLKRHWWKYWQPRNVSLPPVMVKLADGQIASIQAVPLPEEFDCEIQSWDLAFKDKATSDYGVGQVWARKGADVFLLDQHRERMDLPRTKEAIRAMSEKWPQASAKLVEDTANGPAVIQELRHEISGLISVTPEGGKVARAHAVSPQIESGNVYLPHPALWSWVEDFIEEASAFPNGRNDDQVDAMSQALLRLRTIRANFGVRDQKPG